MGNTSLKMAEKYATIAASLEKEKRSRAMKWKSPHEWEKLKQGIDCSLCEDMHLEENRFSFKVAELQQGIVRLGRNQYLPGYTVVIFRRHANELFELSVQELTEFWQDVSRVAKVLYDLYQPTKG